MVMMCTVVTPKGSALSARSVMISSASAVCARRSVCAGGTLAFVDSPQDSSLSSTLPSSPALSSASATPHSFSSSPASSSSFSFDSPDFTTTPTSPTSGPAALDESGDWVVSHIPPDVKFSLAPPSHAIPSLLARLQDPALPLEQHPHSESDPNRSSRGARGNKRDQVLAFNVKDKMSLFLSLCSVLASIQLFLPKTL